MQNHSTSNFSLQLNFLETKEIAWNKAMHTAPRIYISGHSFRCLLSSMLLKFDMGVFHMYLIPLNFSFIYITKWLVQETFPNHFKMFWYGEFRVTENMSLLLLLSLLKYSEMTVELTTFKYLSCHSSSTALETRTG